MNSMCSLNLGAMSFATHAHHQFSVPTLMFSQSDTIQRGYPSSKIFQAHSPQAKLKHHYSTNRKHLNAFPSCSLREASMPRRDQPRSWPGAWKADPGRHHSSKCSLKRQTEGPPITTANSDKTGNEFTVEDAIKAVGFGSFQTFLLVYAGMAWTAEAMEMMLLSFVGPSVKDLWHLSSREESYITSAVFVGMMIGAYSWGFLSDAKGRRVGFFATSILTFIAGLLSAFSSNLWELLLLRGLVGVGLGGGPVVSTWFMEFVPSANRGLWMIIMTSFWTLGSVVEALLAWNVMPGLGWRWLLGLSSVPLAVLLLFYPIVPESPRYLASKGQVTKAWDILQGMARLNQKPLPAGSLKAAVSTQVDHHDGADFKRDQYGPTDEASGSETTPWIRHSSDLSTSKTEGHTAGPRADIEGTEATASVLSPGVRQSTFILWPVFFANAFTYYGLVLLTTQLTGDNAGCGQDSAVHQSVEAAANNNLYRDVLVTSLAELPGLGVAAGIVDVFGRKPSMAVLFTLTGIFMLPLIQHQSETVTTALLFGARASIMGAFTVLYIYAPEVYPTSLRSTGLGIANSFARVGGFVCPFVAVELVQSCQQPLAAGLFAVIPMTAGLLALKFPTETKGRALSDFVE